MDETAIPIAHMEIATQLEPTEQEKDLTDEDKAIAGLLSVPAWQAYEKKVRAKLELLKQSIDTSKMTLAEVGQQYIVISKVCDLVEETLLQVNAQANAVYENEQRERDRAGK